MGTFSLGIASGFFCFVFYQQQYPEAPIVWLVLSGTAVPLVFYGVLFFFWKCSPDLRALITLVFTVLFFGFGHLINLIGRHFDVIQAIPGWLAIWSLFVFARTWFLLAKHRVEVKVWHGPLTWACLTLLLFQCVHLWRIRSGMQQPVAVASTVEVKSERRAVADSSVPNIYVVVLDAYARSDVLRGLFAYDNRWFIQGLEERGFQVGKLSTSNYFLSVQSMSSCFNMDYIQEESKGVPLDSVDLMPLNRIINQHRSRSLLKPLGYRYVATSVLFPPLEAVQADVFVTNPFDHASLFDNLVTTTLLRALVKDHEKYRNFVLRNLRGVPDLGIKYHPMLLYSHITLPHPPFVFDQEGKPLRKKYPISFTDGDDLIKSGISLEDYKTHYVGQLEFTSRETLKMLSRILEEDQSDPYIILMGDHGARLLYGKDTEDPEELLSACANLLAVRVTGSGSVPDQALTCPINLMRYILSKSTGTDLPYLESKVYFTHASAPYVFKDVTEKVRGRFYGEAR
jgi:hypothetical protein